MNSLLEQKLQIEKQLKRINKQLEQGTNMEKIKLIYKKINSIKEVFPSIVLEIQDESTIDTICMSIREFAINNQYHNYIHEVESNDIENDLLIFDNVLNNHNKYKERFNIAHKIIEQLSCKYHSPYIHIIAGTINHDMRETVETPHGSVEEQIIIDGKFNEQNNLDLRFRICYQLDNNISDEYNIELNGFNFKVETLFASDGYDWLEASNNYNCTLENVKVDELLDTIKKLKETTRNHSILINFDKTKQLGQKEIAMYEGK